MASELQKRLERQRAKCVDLNAGNDATPATVQSSGEAGAGSGSTRSPSVEDSSAKSAPLAASVGDGAELKKVNEELRRVRAELGARTAELAALQVSPPKETDGGASAVAGAGGMKERERLRAELAKAQKDADEERRKREATEQEMRATRAMLQTRTADLDSVRSELAEAKRQGSAPDAGASKAAAGNAAAAEKEIEALTRRNAELELELVSVRAELAEVTAVGRDPAGPGGTQGETEAALAAEGGTGSPGDSPSDREGEAAERAEGTLGLLEEQLLQMQARNADLESHTRRRREVLARAQQELQMAAADGTGDEATGA